jgi:hypothetical protein
LARDLPENAHFTGDSSILRVRVLAFPRKPLNIKVIFPAEIEAQE